MLDIQKLFDNIEGKEREKVENLTSQDGIDMLMKIGMFNKTIRNSNIFYEKLKRFVESESDENYQVIDIKNLSERVIYNRSWEFIKDIDLENIEHLTSLKMYNVKSLLPSLKSSISYFQDIEEYEKCAHLFKIQNYLQK